MEFQALYLLKYIASEIVESLMVIRLSLKGIFPEKIMVSKVMPLLKKEMTQKCLVTNVNSIVKM